MRCLWYILDQLGVPAFFDQSPDSMQGGQDNQHEMMRGMYGCRAMVAVLSDNYTKSKVSSCTTGPLYHTARAWFALALGDLNIELYGMFVCVCLEAASGITVPS